MNAATVSCPRCNRPVTESLFNQPELVSCPACAAPLQILTFPALFRAVTPGRGGEALLVETESSCFYHPQKRASVPCDACGRFLCALCDCDLHGQHYCPACLETGRTKGKITKLENTRTLYDSIALRLAILPMVLVIGIYFTFITAPMALYMAIRYWKAPLSIVHRTKARFVVAIILASLQILGWILFIYFLFAKAK